MFNSTKEVLDRYSSMSEEGRRRYLSLAPTEELEIIADYPDKIKPIEKEEGSETPHPSGFGLV